MSPAIQDPSKLKVTELREELQARGLDTKGNKPVLVKRLKKALEEELNQELPDTSIADTTTEELDTTLETSRTDSKSQKENESDVPIRTESVDSRTSQEPESEAEQSVNTDEQDEASSAAPEPENVKAIENENGDDSPLLVSKTPEKGNVDESEEKQSEDKEESKDVEMTEVLTDKKSEHKGEKRKREDESNEPAQKRRDIPVQEDEPEIDPEKVLLSWYDSDLHLQVDKESFLSAKPIHEGLFGYAWAGVRATHGISNGKARYEVKLTEEMKWEDFTSQRRERQEKAKERHQARDKRDREKQRDQSKSKKKPDEGDKKGASDDKKKESDEKKEESDVKKEDSDVKKEDSDVKKEDSDVAKEESDVNKKDADVNKKDESEVTMEESDEKKGEDSEKSEEEKMEVTEEDASKPKEERKEESSKFDEDETKKEESTEESSENVKGESEKIEKSEKTEKTPPKPAEPVLTHIFRIGWSLAKAGLQLGEDRFSYGYESTGKFVANQEFKDFAAPYKLGDVVGAYLSITEDSLEMRYTINGALQPEVMTIPRAELEDDNVVLIPHVLSRNFGFELNLGGKEEPWFPDPEELDGYLFVEASPDKVPGPARPSKKEECEVLMMCGLPGAGKTHWVREYLKSNTDKQINVIGSAHLLDRMTVHGKPLKSSYNGRWNILLDKLQRCLNRLTDMAPQRRRNYIIDQTNVFPSAQRRKLRAFEGFKKLAVVVIVGDEEQAKRQSLKEAQDGKDVPDYAILEMKANMALPTKGDDMWDDIIYADLNEEEAKAQVTKYNAEGKTAGYHPGQRKPPYRNERSRWSSNRNDYNRGGSFHDRGPQRYDRGPRPGGWGHPPPSSRYSRDNRRPPPPQMSGGGRDWMRNNRGPSRPQGGDRNGRDNRPQSSYNRNRTPGGGGGGGRSSNWQSGGGSGYGQSSWGGQQQGNWSGSGAGNQGWGGSNYQQQGNWNQNPWKYGSGGNQQGGGYGQQPQQQGYGGQNWNNYYGQYAQNWSGQGQQAAAAANQYAQWAQYAQQYAQGQNAKFANNAAGPAKK